MGFARAGTMGTGDAHPGDIVDKLFEGSWQTVLGVTENPKPHQKIIKKLELVATPQRGLHFYKPHTFRYKQNNAGLNQGVCYEAGNVCGPPGTWQKGSGPQNVVGSLFAR